MTHETVLVDVDKVMEVSLLEEERKNILTRQEEKGKA
jgi:hypothetical protein